MKAAAWFLGFVAVVTPISPAAQDGFAIWRADELARREAALSKNIAADRSSRETLADYGDHRFRLLYRDGDGNPEEHGTIIDVVYVQSGAGTLVLGGTMTGRRATTANEFVGTGLEGGERHALGAGDIVHIPAGVPHRFLVPAGGHFTYVLLKIPKSD